MATSGQCIEPRFRTQNVHRPQMKTLHSLVHLAKHQHHTAIELSLRNLARARFPPKSLEPRLPMPKHRNAQKTIIFKNHLTHPLPIRIRDGASDQRRTMTSMGAQIVFWLSLKASRSSHQSLKFPHKQKPHWLGLEEPLVTLRG